MEVTQQWAVECQEKDNLIAVLKSQLKESMGDVERVKQQLTSLETRCQALQADKDQLKQKLRKVKKHLSSGGHESSHGAGGSRFEELRVELAQRRELYDQVCLNHVSIM